MIVALLWIILSFVVAGAVGSDRSTGFWGTLFLCLIFSPLIGLLIAGFSAKVTKPRNSGERFMVLQHRVKELSNKAKLYAEMGEREKAIDTYMEVLVAIRGQNKGEAPTGGNLHSAYREVEDRIKKLKAEAAV